MKKQAGFTLLELLVVVLIIGVLAAIALPQYQLAVGKARYMELMAVGDAVHKAEELYWMEHGEYTDDLTKLDIGIDKSHLRSFSIQPKTKSGHYLSVTANNLDAYYVLYFDHHPSSGHRGLKNCRVNTNVTSPIPSKICASITGNTGETNPNYHYWVFKK